MTKKLISLYEKGRNAAAARTRALRLIYESKYGIMPPPPEHLRATLISRDRGFAAGKATLDELLLTVSVGERELSFRINVALPVGASRSAAFIHLSHYDGIVDKFSPAEEILDGGFGLISFSPDEIVLGVKKLLGINRRSLTSAGELCLAAWLTVRVFEYTASLPELDADKIAVIGHGHLGAVAMIAAGADERIKYTVSSCSGIEGAEATDGNKVGATALKVSHPEWFARRYVKTAKDDIESEAYILASTIAPRHLIIGTACDDSALDAKSALLTARATGEIYEKIYGVERGFTEIDKSYKDEGRGGKIAYYTRGGSSYLSRDDWAVYMNYIRQTADLT